MCIPEVYLLNIWCMPGVHLVYQSGPIYTQISQTGMLYSKIPAVSQFEMHEHGFYGYDG
jgi:hypothetical protein